MEGFCSRQRRLFKFDVTVCLCRCNEVTALCVLFLYPAVGSMHHDISVVTLRLKSTSDSPILCLKC